MSGRRQFTVTVGTIFEDSHIPISKWLLAIHLLCASKKGMSAHQLHRMLGVTYKVGVVHGAPSPLNDDPDAIGRKASAHRGGRRDVHRGPRTVALSGWAIQLRR
jgi:hypothetical protein